MEETLDFLNDSAVILAKNGHHKEAIASLRKALLNTNQDLPQKSVMWFNLALSYRSLGNLTEARNALLQALKIHPFEIDYLDTLGVIQHELGEDEGAESCYMTILEFDPGNGRVWNNYGVLQFSQKRYTEACQSFEKALSLIPEFHEALYNLRDTYGELGKTEQMKICTRLLEELGID